MSEGCYPYSEGLCDPGFEHDACGVGFVAHLKGEKSHEIVSKGLEMLTNLEHRGVVGAEYNSGDGAGVLTQMPDAFMRKAGIKEALPPFGEYGVGMVFIPRDPDAYSETQSIVEQCIKEMGQECLGRRRVPTDNSSLGEMVKGVEPIVKQVFIKKAEDIDSQAFERKLFVIRKYAQARVTASPVRGTGYFYVTSMSYKTIVYKGQLITAQLPRYFADLNDPEYISAMALVHSRFSTNTFPSWHWRSLFAILHTTERST